jgi:hypothetical protein
MAGDRRGVSEWLAETRADPLQTIREMTLVQDELVEVRLEMAGGDLGHARLVKGLLGVTDGKDRHPVALLLGEVRQDRGGIYAARQEKSKGYVRPASAADRLPHPVVELLGEVVGPAAGEIGLYEVIRQVPVLLDRDLTVFGN